MFSGCDDSDGLTGFHYSHDGYWNSLASTYEGIISKMECANTCMSKGSCVAISTYATASNGHCLHYSNRADLVSSNELIDVLAKSYIKCLGTDV